MTIAIHIPDYHMTQRKEVVRWLALPGIGIVTLTLTPNPNPNPNLEEQSNTGLGSLLQVDWQNFVGALTKAVDDHCQAATSTAEWDSA